MTTGIIKHQNTYIYVEEIEKQNPHPEVYT